MILSFISDLFDTLSMSVIRNAFIVGVLMAICCALLGVSLVLKKNSMLGDGLSHVGFGSAAVALALGWAPLAVAIPATIAASFIILKLNEKSKIHGDAAIALFSASALAVGYAVYHMTGGSDIDINAYMYGSILGAHLKEVILSIIIFVVVVVTYILLYNRIFASTFDESFAKSSGSRVNLIRSIIAILSSVTVVIGMKIMGALLITSLIIFPTLSSRQIFKTFKSVTISSVIISIISTTLGLLLSCIIDTMPAGSAIVFANLFTLIVFIIVGKILSYRKKNIKINEGE